MTNDTGTETRHARHGTFSDEEGERVECVWAEKDGIVLIARRFRCSGPWVICFQATAVDLAEGWDPASVSDAPFHELTGRGAWATMRTVRELFPRLLEVIGDNWYVIASCPVRARLFIRSGLPKERIHAVLVL